MKPSQWLASVDGLPVSSANEVNIPPTLTEGIG